LEKKQLEGLQDVYCTKEAGKLYRKVRETKKSFLTEDEYI
jgi:hypothetical protein